MKGAQALSLSAAALSLGCYTYVPATLDALPLGASVRALLTTETQLALRDSLGLDQQAVQGTLVNRDANRVLLAIRSDDGTSRAGSHALYQRITVAPRDVLQLEVKQFHRARTIGLLAAVTTAATIVAIQAIGKGNPGTPEPPGGGPPERLVGW